ncbi:MAG: TonB family protein [Zoogloeaceae bacterium]|jgi:protein TonB|nr:TonB family protein [Zoogloeaceae bacterium]
MTALALALPPRTTAPVEWREWVARLGAAILGGLIWLSIQNVQIRHEPPAAPMSVILLDAPPEPEPEPEPETEPEPPRLEPPPPREKPAPQPRPEPPAAVTPTEVSPAPAEAPPASVTLPELPVDATANTLPPPEAKKNNSAAEGHFTREVRALIEKGKRYPAAARDLGMTGTVEVRYVLDRSGRTREAEVVVSSGHPLLDQAALKAVENARFAAMPEDAWIGKTQKEFRTRLIFSLDH